MKHNLMVYRKDLAMSAMDVVPGFPGRKVALSTGIYHRLLVVFASTLDILLLFFRGRIVESYQRCDATFLLVRVFVILTSIFTLERFISYLIVAHPVQLWSFFFGLVVVSVCLVGREVAVWSADRLVEITGEVHQLEPAIFLVVSAIGLVLCWSGWRAGAPHRSNGRHPEVATELRRNVE